MVKLGVSVVPPHRDVVNGAACECDAGLECLALGVHPLEGRQQRWMHIEEAAAPSTHEGLSQDAHEAGQTDHVCPGRLQLTVHRRLKLFPILVVLVRNHLRSKV